MGDITEIQGRLSLAPGEKLWPEMVNVAGTSMPSDDLAGALEFLAGWSYQTTESKGFYNDDESESDEKTLLLQMHCEISEAVEALRVDNPESQKIPGYSSVEEEMADLILRVLAFGKRHGYDVPAAVMAKGFYNESRPRLHGGKKF